MAELTPSQTIGPFFHAGLSFERMEKLAGAGVPGERIAVRGRLLDGKGAPVADALIEIWQADAQGRYPRLAPDPQGEPAAVQPGFRGFGRAMTEEDGSFRFESIKPGSVAGSDGALQAPHLVLGVFARGVLNRLITRAYFDDEPANARDPVLARVPEARRATLIAARTAAGQYRFDIALQGERETVFFDV